MTAGAAGARPAATMRVRAGLGIFGRSDRGLLAVAGVDRERWLDGMLTQNVKRLVARGEGAGAHALFLTHRGAIVADLRIGVVGETIVLELERAGLVAIRGALEKRIIADEVVIEDRSGGLDAIGIEGAAAEAVLARILEVGLVPADGDWVQARVAGQDVLVGAFGWSGERAFQLHGDASAMAAARQAARAAAAELGVDCVAGDAALQEILRVEAGIPRIGAELDEEVLPPEARLDSAISTNKGCYVGQEIVARLRARGQVNHLLVGLRPEGDARFAVGGALAAGGRRVGELTSVVESPCEGVIALGFVRREQAEPGSRLEMDASGHAIVCALPFVVPRSLAPDHPIAEAPPSPPAASAD